MQFTKPLALISILVLPLFFFLGWPARGYNRRREIISLAVRVAICLCLVMAIAGLEIREWGQGNKLAVVFLLDVSDSMPDAAIQSGINYIQQAIASMAPDDQAALVVFGQEALVERPMSAIRELDALTSIPATSQTNLAQAIHLGLALYPPAAARRMVILSDGVVTAGNASEAVQVAAASGVEVLVLPFLTNPGAEVMVSEVQAPTNLRQGDRFDLNVTLEASQAENVTIQVFAQGSLVYEGEQALEKGSQVLSLPLTADQPGFISYQVKIGAPQDHYYQNNSLSSYSQISGPPRILLVAPPAGELLGFKSEPRPDEYSALLKLLKATGFQVDLVSPLLLPSELPALAAYASVVLVDVPARDLTSAQMSSLQAYVRDLGGGLVAVGGPTSYGVGGYFRTPLEETLPVEMQIKDEQRRPTLAMVFIIDHSGSMAETSGGPTKLELAKEAVLRSLDLLSPMDQVGVVIFDDAASWVVNVQELGDGGVVKNKVASIGIGGGTDILAGVQAMAAVMPSVEAGARHVILLTDGGADPAGIAELVSKLYTSEGITLSAIGVGADAAPFLPQLAEAGGGRYHFVADPASIPNIFTEETTLATRAYIIEEPFVPQLLTPSPILGSITALPQLYGYIGTSSKETAQTILVSQQGDPILASWRYGLGKAVAFTSDATGRWAKDWLNWDNFSAFWSQVVRSTLSESQPSNLSIQVQPGGGSARLVVDASAYPGSSTSETGQYLNNYAMQANIISPDGSTQAAALHQVAPGRYEGSFLPTEEGVYLLRVDGQPPAPGAPGIGEIAGWALDYSPEYRQLQPDPDALVRLAIQAGGRIVESDPTQAFAHTLPAPGTFWPAWPVLLALAAVLLPFDIAVRRLVVTRSDIQRSAQALRRWVQLRSIAPQPAPQRQETMRGLLRAKQNVGDLLEKNPAIKSSPQIPGGSPLTGQPQQNNAVKTSQTYPPRSEPSIEKSQPDLSSQESAKTNQTAASAVDTLLKRKRARRDQDSRNGEE